MNPCTHAHGFVSPGLYKGKLVMCQKLPRIVDQPVQHKVTLLTESSMSCCSEK